MERDAAYLYDILESAKQAIAYVSDVTADSFTKDVKLQDAVIRRLEIIGEAARRVSSELKTKEPQIPWSEMIGLRNLMIHEYDNIDMEIIWATLETDLPMLVKAVDKILS